LPLWRRSCTLKTADQLGIVETSQSSNGTRPTRFHALYVYDGKRKTRLAEDIVDRTVADALQEPLIKLLKSSG
jgi:hypothetical protein